MPNADRHNHPGEVQLLGRYRLRGVLGQGGMGRLYVAEQKGIEGFTKIVAVKQILPHLADSPQFRRMFLTEARVAARLEHPNIVVTYELGEVEGIYFMAMEYLPGEDLGAALSRAAGRPMPLEIAVGTTHQALSGLQYAHDLRDTSGHPSGLVHRDVNPSNIFVTYYGMVKLLDFGVVKGAGGAGTSPGTFKGKYGYCAPEQLEGDSIDRRTDVFCVGIVLWESLTGQRLFKGASDAAVIDAVRGQPIARPSSLRPDLPEELDHITMKALTRNRDARFQSAHEMAEALDRFLNNRPRPTPKSIGQWLEGLFGPERAHLKKAIAQGNDIEGTLDKLRAMPSSTTLPATGSQMVGGAGSQAGARRSGGGSVGSVASGVYSSVSSSAPRPRASVPTQPRTLWSTSVRQSSAGERPISQPSAPVSQAAQRPPTFVGFGESGEGSVDKPVEEATSRFVVPQELAAAAGFNDTPPPPPAEVLADPGYPAPIVPLPVESLQAVSPGARPAVAGGSRAMKIIAALGMLGAAAALAISLGDSQQGSVSEGAAVVSSSGAFELKSEPPGAQVLIDGAPTGLATPTLLSNLRRGSVLEVRLDKPGFQTAIQKITVPAEGQGSQSFKLIPAGGNIRLEGLPEGASVFVDDVLTDTTGTLSVALGRRKLRVESGGEVIFDRIVEAIPGEQKVDVRAGGRPR